MKKKCLGLNSINITTVKRSNLYYEYLYGVINYKCLYYKYYIYIYMCPVLFIQLHTRHYDTLKTKTDQAGLFVLSQFGQLESKTPTKPNHKL